MKNEDYLKAVEETREAPISESVETNGIKALESNPEDASTFESFVSEEEANAFTVIWTASFQVCLKWTGITSSIWRGIPRRFSGLL